VARPGSRRDRDDEKGRRKVSDGLSNAAHRVPQLVAAAVMGMGVVGVAEIDTDGDTPDEIRCNPLLEFLERRVQVLHDVTSMKSC